MSLICIPHETVVELRRQERPVAGPGQVLVRTRFTLVSPGTELSMFSGTHSALADPEVPWAKYPFFPGYAAVGEVVESRAQDASLVPGDRVFFLGKHAAWAAFDPATAVYGKLNPGDDERAILFARLLQISSTAAYLTEPVPETVLVLGAGIVGILAAVAFRERGARQIVIHDLNPDRLRLARATGVPEALAAGPDLNERVSAIGGGRGPECVVEATGVPALVGRALEWVRRRGEVILLGSPRGQHALDLYKLVHLKCTRITGAHETVFADHAEAPTALSRQLLLDRALEVIRAGRLDPMPLLGPTIRPAGLAATYCELASGNCPWVAVAVGWEAEDAT